MFSRFQVPVDKDRSNQFYILSWHAKSAFARLGWKLWYHLYFGWKMLDNFSSQDARMAEITDYRASERLTPSDVFMANWRRFVLENARGLKEQS